MTRQNVAVLMFGTMMLATSLQAADFIHPRLKDKEVTIANVVMLPPVVEMTKNSVKGKEGMGKEAEEAITQFQDGVAAALKERHMAVETPFTDDAMKGNDELRNAVADVQKRFDDIATQLFKKHKDVRKGRFTLGDSVAILNTKGNADALVIIRAAGQKKTKSKTFMSGGGLIGVARSGTPNFLSRVALVDAKNGDILFLGDYESHGMPKQKTYEKSFQSFIGKVK
jgi:hypothetical protein